MNVLREVITAFCAASIFIGALYIICPDGVMNKSVKYILSLIFLITIVTATGITVKKADFNFNIPEYNEANAEPLDVAAAEYAYAYALQAADINFSKITVCTDKTQNGSIVINKVIICSTCEKSQILQALGEVSTNFEVEIINE